MAYNFNPKQNIRRNMKFEEYSKHLGLSWSMVPIGSIDVNNKYLTACASSYKSYNECLRSTLFDKEVCKPKLHQVETCQVNNDLLQTQTKLAILKSYKKKKPKKLQDQSTVAVKSD